jgi:hypothetical protein
MWPFRTFGRLYSSVLITDSPDSTWTVAMDLNFSWCYLQDTRESLWENLLTESIVVSIDKFFDLTDAGLDHNGVRAWEWECVAAETWLLNPVQD